MRLILVEGYREYLLPRPIPHRWLAQRLREIAPNVEVLETSFVTDQRPYHTFVEDDPGAVELLVEYALDCSADGDTRALVLPSRRCVAPGECPIVERLRTAAVRAIGADRVRSVCVTVSRAANETLRALHRQVASAPSEGEWGEELVLAPTRRDAAGALLEANYTEAALALAEQMVAEPSLLRAHSGRAQLVAERLHDARLSLDARLPAARVLESLEPGGELHELLFRRIFAGMEP